MDIRVRVSGGGHTSQIYAIRQAVAKACVAYWAKYYDAAHALSLKKSLVDYDRALLIADPRRMEPKKFGGPGARARRQKRCGICSFTGMTDVLMPFSFQLPIGASCCLDSYIASVVMLYGSLYAPLANFTPPCRNHLMSRFVFRFSWGTT